MIIRMDNLGRDISGLDGLWAPTDYLALRVTNQIELWRELPTFNAKVSSLSRAISLEPLRLCVDLSRVVFPGCNISLVRLAGQTGHKARPMHPQWVRSVQRTCLQAGVKFVFAGWGRWCPIEGDPARRQFLKNRQTVWVALNGRTYEDLPVRDTGLVRELVEMSSAGLKHSGRAIDGQEWRAA